MGVPPIAGWFIPLKFLYYKMDDLRGTPMDWKLPYPPCYPPCYPIPWPWSRLNAEVPDARMPTSPRELCQVEESPVGQ